MRTQINENNIKNVLKFYEYIDRESFDSLKPSYKTSYFENYEFDFEDNYSMWENNKEHIYKLFGDKVKIYKELDEATLCSSEMVNFIRASFLEENGKDFTFLIKVFLEALYPQELLANKLLFNYKFLDVELKKGCKISKCFALLELNKKRLKKQQDLYSIFLQGLYVKGRLVLSIDPLDFITMSVSKSGWSSCHHPGGGYGAGGLAYMNDSVSIVAYVETETPIQIKIDDTTTNNRHTIQMPNKIWRQMITLNDKHEYAMLLKEYPNPAVSYAQATSDLLIQLLETEGEKTYKLFEQSREEDCGFLQRNIRLPRIIFYCDYAHNNMRSIKTIMSNDFNGFDDLIQMLKTEPTKKIRVGESVYCACGCGTENFTSHAFVEEAYNNDDSDEY